MKQKTAMQELIQSLNYRLKNYEDLGYNKAFIALELTIREAEDLLEKEKQQIIDAVNSDYPGYYSYFPEYESVGHKYYDITYKQD